MRTKPRFEGATAIEAVAIGILALGLYLPFLAIQFDTNGIMEATALEAGQLVNKNHMLYRPIGAAIYDSLQHFGYAGNSLLVLQTMNAVCGAIGIGLAYAFFKWAAHDRAAAVVASVWLATSFSYWLFSTDAAYITLAGMFALAAVVCILYTESAAGAVAAGIFTTLSILTWQASIFLIPTFLLLFAAGPRRPALRHAAVFATMIGAAVTSAYLVTAFVTHGAMGPRALWAWFTSYSEGGTLPLWGVWDSGRIASAAVSALRSVVPVLLVVRPTEITMSVQLGRIAVDFALIAFVVLMILAALKIRLNSMRCLFGYALFIPFIVWWDPFEPKWFFIPNIFLAGFISCGLQPWLHRKRAGFVVIACALAIAGANFVTTIRPRHKNLGPDRSIARCVAEHMQTSDAFIAAEWGWPDYIGYVYHRTAINLINETAFAGTKDRMLANVKTFIASTEQKGGHVYVVDPSSHPQAHLDWLRAQTGLTPHDLQTLQGEPAFICADRTILGVP